MMHPAGTPPPRAERSTRKSTTPTKACRPPKLDHPNTNTASAAQQPSSSAIRKSSSFTTTTTAPPAVVKSSSSNKNKRRSSTTASSSLRPPLIVSSNSRSSTPQQQRSPPPTQRWQQAVERLLDDSRRGRPPSSPTRRRRNNVAKQQQQHDEPDDDRMGQELIRRLLQQAEQQERAMQGQDDRCWKMPLLSRHNAHVVSHWLVGSLRLLLGRRKGRGKNIDNSKNTPRALQQQQSWIEYWSSWFVCGPPRPSLWNIGSLLWRVLAFGSVGIVLFMTGLIWIGAFVLYKITIKVLGFLVDWNDVQNLLPDYCRTIAQHIRKLGAWLDFVILQGRRYAGREWTANQRIVWSRDPPNDDDDKDIASRHISLWELPPPPPEDWPKDLGRASKAHLEAIDFCYTMIKSEHDRKQRKRRIRQMGIRSASAPLGAVGSTADDDASIGIGPSGSFGNNDMAEPSDTASSVFVDDDAIELMDTTSSGTRLRRSGSSRTKTTKSDSHDSTILNRRANRRLLRVEAGPLLEGPEALATASDIVCSPNDDSELIFSDEEDMTVKSMGDLSDTAEDLPWFDVGARIGMRIFHSEHVQRAMASQETKDRILETMVNLDQKHHLDAIPSTEPRKKLSKPMHPMWTSPDAAARSSSSILPATNSMGELDDLQMIARESSLDSHSINQSLSFPGSPAPGSSTAKAAPTQSSSEFDWNDESPTVRKRRFELPSSSSPRSEDKRFSGYTDSQATNRQAVSPIQIQKDSLSESFVGTPVLPKKSHKRTSSNGLYLTPPEMKTSITRQSVTPKFRKRSPRKKGQALLRRIPLLRGVKIAVPVCPMQPKLARSTGSNKQARIAYQMATVVSSERIYVGDADCRRTSSGDTNCLSVTVKLERSFLRNGEFAELTFRVMDHWGARFMPRHSKLPIGSCVATSYGIGVLVGWRVEDDCHVVRSLWRLRGDGSAHAYLNRHALRSTVEAAVGFEVQTVFGTGIVVACANTATSFETCTFLVEIRDEGRHHGNVLEICREEILSCPGAQFIPVIEHVREAALYQIQVDNYNAALRAQRLDEELPSVEQDFVRSWSECADILWLSFLKAVEEDQDFDDGVNDFMISVIDFLNRLNEEKSPSSETDGQKSACECEEKEGNDCPYVASPHEIEVQLAPSEEGSKNDRDTQEPGFWIMNDLFGGIFGSSSRSDDGRSPVDESVGETEVEEYSKAHPSYYDRTFAFLRTLMKTVSIARATSVNHSHFRLALAITYDFLLFIRTIVKIQQRNDSTQSLKVWQRAWDEIVATFGPIKQRLESIGHGIAARMESQGRKAKVRVLKFVDRILTDERLLFALEQGEWDRCFARLEIALVEAQIIQEENLLYYRKAAKFVHDQIEIIIEDGGGAATRNGEMLAFVAQLIQAMASPKRSLLKFFCSDDMLEAFERILVRAYHKEEVAARMLLIHAANFHTLRHLRMLKDFSVAGRIWIPLLDAADEEFSWVVSNMPEKSKEFMCPLSSLFSLCVAQFHKINAGDLSKDWLAFLLEEDSVRIIHDMDMLLILALEAFSKDLRDMITVLPYYPSIDMDILNLMDEVNLDVFLKEATDAMEDPESLALYIREKATIAIERFLNYLPKMSIPVEKRELGEGWVLTCHGSDGGGLTLSDVTIKRENLVCQVMGGDTLFFPMFADSDDAMRSVAASGSADTATTKIREEESILDHIRELILNAKRHGCWEAGVGGVVRKPPSDRYAASVLRGLPVSNVLNCGIEMWRNLEIDDDELLEIAIRDIAYHIQLHDEREKGLSEAEKKDEDDDDQNHLGSQLEATLTASSSSGDSSVRPRFNPRQDPTVLFLEIKNLTLNLDNFVFRIEKGIGKTIFDPVFQGTGRLSLHNICIRLRVEVARERVKTPGRLAEAASTPVLLLQDLDVSLEGLDMTVTDTGFGSDWILNKAVEVFEVNITRAVKDNLKEQIREQAQNALEALNSYFLVNPQILLNLLGISMDDLDENVVWV